MTASDRLGETYVAALRHDLVEVSPEAALVGVVRRPTGRFDAAVDENYPALGPPEDLLDEFERRREEFKMRGMCDEGAHNAAWDAVGFTERYRAHLSAPSAARSAVDELARRLRGGERLVLVCFENADRKRCHRTLLLERLDSRL